MWYPWTNDYDRTISFSDLFRQLERVARPSAQADTEPATTLLETAGSYSFPTKLDAERTSAKLDAGVLTVKVAKLPDNQPRRVQIGVS